MSKRHRRHSTAKKREIVEAYLNGEALHALGKPVLASVLAVFNLTAFLMQSACDLVCGGWQQAGPGSPPAAGCPAN